MGFKTLPSKLSDAVLTVANVAALSAVTDPQEGDERYVADIDVLYMYTGAAWAPSASSSGAPLAPSRGGTGISNNDAATLTRTGNHAVTITTTGTTGVTLPTSGTLGAVPTAGVVTSSGTALTSEAALDPSRGGTGVANNAAATLTRSGNHAWTVTTGGTSNTTIPTGTKTLVASGDIVNADINASAAIDGSKIVAATDAVAGAMTTAAQTLAGDKTFTGKTRASGGLTIEQYYGSIPEVGGSTPFQMVVGNKNIQVITSTAGNTVRLPTTNVKKGEIFEIHLTNTAGTVTITSSDGDTLIVLYQGFARYIAVQDTPTDSTHWYLMNIEDNNFFTSNSTSTNWSKSFVCYWARSGSAAGKVITFTTANALANATVGGMSTYITFDLSNMPAGIRPVIDFIAPVFVDNTTPTTVGRIDIQTSGNGEIYSAHTGSGNFTAASGASAGMYPSTFSWRA